jgi:hypothetical protein
MQAPEIHALVIDIFFLFKISDLKLFRHKKKRPEHHP